MKQLSLLRKSHLYIVIFITGAVSLCIEVAAMRVLSPYFGNTIYTVSSVISVILAALSVGYYAGGRMADRFPSPKIFYGIIALTGIQLFFIEAANVLILPFFGYRLSLIVGPLIVAAFLFFLPSMFLGFLSPYVVKLQKSQYPKEGIGSVAGEVFFWSTLGSIFGSLATGFLLIPTFGINQIFFGSAVTLFLLGGIPLFILTSKKKRLIPFLAISVIAFSAALTTFSLKTNKAVLYVKDGMYEKLMVRDGFYKGKPARLFNQDRSASGAMYLNSGELPFAYTNYYKLYKIFKPNIQHALVIGGGIYSIPKALISEEKKVVVDVVEIEPSLYDLSKRYFGLKDNPRLINHITDGRRYLYETKISYDMIYSDVYYSLFSIPSHFTTQEFFRLSKQKLSNDGIFVANIIGSLARQKPSFLLSEIKTFKSVFPNSYFIAVQSSRKRDSQNIIFLGINGTKKFDPDNLPPELIDINRFNLETHPVLTDNYAPTDTMTAAFLQKDLQPQRPVDGGEMIGYIDQQLAYGPRFLSSKGHIKVQQFIKTELRQFTKNVEEQSWTHSPRNGTEYELKNIIARFSPEKKQRVLVATHYDSKRFANKDIFHSDKPVPGANDSASGVAALLEISHYLSVAEKEPAVGVDIAFFDGEEGEEQFKKGEWKPIGSLYFTEHLKELYADKLPQAAIVVDMICDKNLLVKKEQSSIDKASSVVDKLWSIGNRKYPTAFSKAVWGTIHDDHTSLQNIGIPAALIIDFDYQAFHTTADTADKCSGKSLEIVTTTLLEYLYNL